MSVVLGYAAPGIIGILIALFVVGAVGLSAGIVLVYVATSRTHRKGLHAGAGVGEFTDRSAQAGEHEPLDSSCDTAGTAPAEADEPDAPEPEPVDPGIVLGFRYVIGRAFLDDPAHAITILPKFNEVLDEHLPHTPCEVTPQMSNGALSASLHRGEGEYGPYYQLRLTENRLGVLDQKYQPGQSVRVEMRILDDACSVALLADEA